MADINLNIKYIVLSILVAVALSTASAFVSDANLNVKLINSSGNMVNLSYITNITTYADVRNNSNAYLVLCGLNTTGNYTGFAYAVGNSYKRVSVGVSGGFGELLKIASVNATNCTTIDLDFSTFFAWYPAIPQIIVSADNMISSNDIAVPFSSTTGWLKGSYNITKVDNGTHINLTVTSVYDHNNNAITTNKTYLVVGISNGTVLDSAITYPNGLVTLSKGGYSGSVSVVINGITVQGAPTHNNPKLNATDHPNNKTTANLTCYNQSTADPEGDSVTNVYNWYKNGISYAKVIYAFDNSISSTSQDAIIDYSGSTNSGTLGDGAGNYAPTWNSSGKIGGAYDFGKTGTSYILIDDQNSLDTKEFTFEAWIKPRNLSNAYPTVYTRQGQSGTVGFIWLMIYGNTIYYQYANGTDIRAAQTSALTWNMDQWYHLAVTSSNVTKKIYIYRNGTNVGSFDIDQILPMEVSAGYLGTYNGYVGGTYDWNGTIDEVRIYNRTLSAEEIYQRWFETKDGLTNNATITADETSKGDSWICEVTPNDGLADGTAKNSTALTIQNTYPTGGAVTVTPSPVTLIACSNRTGYCSATVTDVDNYSDISAARAEFYDDDAVDTGCSANPINCYTNSSCALISCSGNGCTANCTINNMRYYTNPSANWKCNITFNDSSNAVNSTSATATVSNLTALDVPASLDFGSIQSGSYSSNISHSVQNCGNNQLDIQVNGSNTMGCSRYGSIFVGNVSYSATQSGGYTNLTNTYATLDLNVIRTTTDTTSTKNSWWRLYVPYGVAGTCTGTITMLAKQG